MWAVIAKLLIQAAMWCLHNPAKVEFAIEEIHTIAEDIYAAKQAK